MNLVAYQCKKARCPTPTKSEVARLTPFPPHRTTRLRLRPAHLAWVTGHSQLRAHNHGRGIESPSQLESQRLQLVQHQVVVLDATTAKDRLQDPIAGAQGAREPTDNAIERKLVVHVQADGVALIDTPIISDAAIDTQRPLPWPHLGQAGECREPVKPPQPKAFHPTRRKITTNWRPASAAEKKRQKSHRVALGQHRHISVTAGRRMQPTRVTDEEIAPPRLDGAQQHERLVQLVRVHPIPQRPSSSATLQVVQRADGGTGATKGHRDDVVLTVRLVDADQVPLRPANGADVEAFLLQQGMQERIKVGLQQPRIHNDPNRTAPTSSERLLRPTPYRIPTRDLHPLQHVTSLAPSSRSLA